MFFIITALAAVVSTIVWYVNAPNDKYKLNILCFIYWGATLMWFVDHVMAYISEGGVFFEFTQDATMLGIFCCIVRADRLDRRSYDHGSKGRIQKNTAAQKVRHSVFKRLSMSL